MTLSGQAGSLLTTMSTLTKLRKNPPAHSWESWGTGRSYGNSSIALSSCTSSPQPSRSSRTLSYAVDGDGAGTNNSSAITQAYTYTGSKEISHLSSNMEISAPNSSSEALRTTYQDFEAPPLPQTRREQYWAYRAFKAESKAQELQSSADAAVVSVSGRFDN